MPPARLRPAPQRPAAKCAAGALLPALLSTSDFGVLAVGYEIGSPAELWTGTIVLSSLRGLLIAFLLVLPRTRATPR